MKKNLELQKGAKGPHCNFDFIDKIKTKIKYCPPTTPYMSLSFPLGTPRFRR